MRLNPQMPIFLIGGVIAHHPFLKNLLKEKFNKEMLVGKYPQHMASFGAAIIAKNTYLRTNEKSGQTYKTVIIK